MNAEPTGSIFATKPADVTSADGSNCPWNAPGVVGRSGDWVTFVTYASPAASVATPAIKKLNRKPLSETPPIYEEYTSAAPRASSFATNPVPSLGKSFGACPTRGLLGGTTGRLGESVIPATIASPCGS